MQAGQLTLDFEHRPALGGEDFLVAPPNAEAVRWLDAWPDWPGTALVLSGPAGSGKTHLAQVFQAMSRACVVSAPDLRESQPPSYLGDAPAAIVENADGLIGEGGLEEPLLHLFNVLKETDRQLLMTAKQPPARWGIGLRDLSSRLNAASQASIGAPDDALIAAVLVKQFQDRQFLGRQVQGLLFDYDRALFRIDRQLAQVDIYLCLLLPITHRLRRSRSFAAQSVHDGVEHAGLAGPVHPFNHDHVSVRRDLDALQSLHITRHQFYDSHVLSPEFRQ